MTKLSNTYKTFTYEGVTLQNYMEMNGTIVLSADVLDDFVKATLIKSQL